MGVDLGAIESGAVWHVVRRECLKQHGAVRAVAWAPPEHGTLLACACSDGTVTVLAHHPSNLRTQDAIVEHRWDGIAEMLAAAVGDDVVIWEFGKEGAGQASPSGGDGGQWRV